MELVNALDGYPFAPDRPQRGAVYREAIESVVLLLSPFAPHVAEELWMELGHPEGSILRTPWPRHDPAAMVRSRVEIVIQVNGKVRGRVTVEAGLSQDALREIALADPTVQKFIDGKIVRKAIVVPDKLINIAVG
jgi:leucyl-tRNA synthetase